MELLQSVKMEDLTPDQQELAELVGMPTFLKLVEECGGGYIYVPKADSISRRARNALIKSDYDGTNLKALAAKYRLTEIQIRHILAEPNKKS